MKFNNSMFIYFAILIASAFAIVCDSNLSKVTFIRNYAGSAEEETYKLWLGTTTTGTLLSTVSGESYWDYLSDSTDLCLSNGLYIIEMSDTYGDGWGEEFDKSDLVIYVNDIFVLRTSMTYLQGNTYYSITKEFSIESPSNYKNEYSYSLTAQTTNSWTQSIPSDWSTATVSTLSMGSNLITRYFIKQITMTTSMENIATIGISIKTKAGFIMYVNGDEVIRHKLPQGDITSSTVATSSNDNYQRIHYITVPKLFFEESSTVIIAVETHQRAETNTDLVFDMATTVIQSYDNVYRSLYSMDDVDLDCNEDMDYYGCKQLVDEFTSSSYYSNEGSFIFTFTLPDGVYEWVNNYILVSSESETDGDPKSWSLLGSLDKQTWTTLDVQSNVVFSNRFEKKSFDITANSQVYHYYKFLFNESTQSSISITDLILTTGHVNAVTASLSYPETSYSPYVNIDILDISPSNSLYTSFVSVPAFPTGLSLNALTGKIEGIVTFTTSITFTINAVTIGTGIPSSIDITINPLVCLQPTNASIRIVKVNTYSSREETYSLSYSNDDIIYESTINSVSNVNVTISKCVRADIIKVNLFDSGNDGWTAGSFLYIYLVTPYGENAIAQFTLGKTSTDTYIMNLKMAIADNSPSWKFLDTSIPTNWFSNSFDDTLWNDYTSTSINTIQSTSRIWLFRKTFTFIKNSQYSAFELGIRLQGGFIIYINGKEYTRELISQLTGDITSETLVSTSASSIVNSFFLEGPISLLNDGENTISIGLILPQSTSSTIVSFDMYMLPLIHSSKHSRFFITTLTSSPTSTNTYKLIDSSSKYPWIISMYSKVDVTLTFTMPSNRLEYFNKFCLTNDITSENTDVSSWTLSVSDDGITYSTIHEMSDFIFESRSQTVCFYPSFLTKPYHFIKFVIHDNNSDETKYSLGEIGFLVEDIDMTNIPELSFTPNSLSTYVNMKFPTFVPSSILYSQFTISPSLPTSLTLDPFTGVLKGISSIPISKQDYTISAITPSGITVSTIISLEILMCSYPNTQFSVFVSTGTYGTEMSYILSDSKGEEIHRIDSFGNNKEYTYVFCKASDVYTLTMKDQYKDGWDSGYIKLYNDMNDVLFKGAIPTKLASISYNISIGYIVSYSGTQWSFYDNKQIPSQDWNTNNYDDSQWSKYYTVTLPELLLGKTQYYRHIFNVDTSSIVSGYDFTVRISGGCIVYINGNELFRANMPDGTISYETSALDNINNEIKVYGISLAKNKHPLINGQNLISIEVHQTNNSTNSIVYAAISSMNDGSWKSHDGTAFDDQSNDPNDVIKLFDNSDDTFFASGPRCIGASYTYNFQNNKKEIVNSYSITTGPICNRRHPTSWIIEASNDNTTWTTLHLVENAAFSIYKQTNTYQFYNDISYSYIRYTALECNGKALNGVESSSSCNKNTNGDQGFQLSEIAYYTALNDYSCAPNNDFIGSLNQEYGFKSCPNYYKGRIQAFCNNTHYEVEQNYCTLLPITGIQYNSYSFVLHVNKQVYETPIVYGAEYTCKLNNDTLPANLEILKDGTLSGKPKQEVVAYSFSVTCMNSAGSFSQSFLLTVLPDNSFPIWAIILLVVIIVIIILLLILCIVKRSSSKRKINSIKHQEKSKGNDKNTQVKSSIKI